MKKLSHKMLLSYSFIMLLVLIMGLLTFLNMTNLRKEVKVMSVVGVIRVDLFEQLSKKMINNMTESTAMMQSYLMTGNPVYKTNYDLFHSEIASELNELSANQFVTTAEKEQIGQLVALHQDIQNKVNSDVLSVYEKGEAGIAQEVLRNSFKPITKQFLDRVALLNDSAKEDVKQRGQTLMRTSVSMSVTTVIIVLAIVALGVLISLFTANHITRRIQTVVGVAKKIAAGDLAVSRIEEKSMDEIGQLTSSVNDMAGNLRSLISQVAISAEQVAAASEQLTASAEQTSKATEEITGSVQELAGGSEEQFSSAESTAQTVNQIIDRLQEVGTLTQKVTATSQTASDVVVKGNNAIQVAVREMNSVNTSVNDLTASVKNLWNRSKQIDEIVGVITGISAQTNLLALNAAIEAARAGDHGKGFAVVAHEVRKLAEQSAASAQEINSLIGTIQEEIDHVVNSSEKGTRELAVGMNAVQAAGESFTQIHHAVDEVTNQVDVVSGAIEHISGGAEQVTGSMNAMIEIADTVASGSQNISAATEEQLASMEEIAKLASVLAKQAEELQTHVSEFRL